MSESDFLEEFAQQKVFKLAWCSVELSPTLPTEILESVVGATMHLHNDRLVVIGGRGSRNCNIYQKNLNIEYKTVTGGRADGEVPRGRAHHCGVLWRHLVIVFGGELAVPDAPLNKECLSDTSILNLYTEMWSRPPSIGLMMPGLKCAGYCAMGKFMVVNGGVMFDDSFSNETFAFDTGVFKWSRVVTFWDTQIACHTMCPVYNDLDGQNLYNGAKKTLTRRKKPESKIRIEGIYIYGGKDRNGQPMGGLRILDTQSKPWSVIQPPTKGLSPRPRFGHCCHYSPLQNYLIIYGGRNDSIYELSGTCVITDVTILDLATFTWSPVTSLNSHPGGGRYFCASAIRNSQFFIVGGLNDHNFAGGSFECLDLDEDFTEKILLKDYDVYTRNKRREKNIIEGKRAKSRDRRESGGS